MGKKAKEHRKKVAKRNKERDLQKKKIENYQRDMIMKMIEKEKNAGLYNNNVPMAQLGESNLSNNDDIGKSLINDGPQI